MAINLVKINSLLSKHIPEQRIYLRSDKTARYVRLSPVIQTVAGTTFALSFCWVVVATVMLAVQAISAKTDTPYLGAWLMQKFTQNGQWEYFRVALALGNAHRMC